MNTTTERIISQINKLRKEREAVILAHNYQIPPVQDIADFVGDSLELSRKAAQTNCKAIVFCGVRFMAETAYILSPSKTVLLPDINAGCPLADMVDINRFRELKYAVQPNPLVLCYVNSSAEIKAESDICCTSANALKIVQSIKNGSREILFVPDKHLGNYVSMKTGRKLLLAKGFCPTHYKILKEDILKIKDRYPDAVTIVHPECTSEVIEIADFVCSTSQMVKVVKESSARRFIIGTEEGLLYKLKKENPEKEFFSPSDRCICPNMKLTTLEKILWSLESMENKIVVEDSIRIKALHALEKMLEYV